MKRKHLLLGAAAALGVYWFILRQPAKASAAVMPPHGYLWGADPSGAPICTDAGGRVVVRSLCGG